MGKSIDIFAKLLDRTVVFILLNFQLKIGKLGLASLLNGISTFMGYVMSKPSMLNKSCDII